MSSERWQHCNVIFTHRLVALLVKSVDFSHLCCIMCQCWHFKHEEKVIFVFPPKVCMAVTEEGSKIS